ncbi:MAG: MBL fold metallo-hydrolase, partial [Sphingorhabdus sp.]
MRLLPLLLLTVATPAFAAEDAALLPKPASSATSEANAKIKAALPVEDGRDEAFSDQGFIATRTDPLIQTVDGKLVWNLDAYKWMEGDAPATVNPSLWRHMKLLRKHGLYKVADNV